MSPISKPIRAVSLSVALMVSLSGCALFGGGDEEDKTSEVAPPPQVQVQEYRPNDNNPNGRLGDKVDQNTMPSQKPSSFDWSNGVPQDVSYDYRIPDDQIPEGYRQFKDYTREGEWYYLLKEVKADNKEMSKKASQSKGYTEAQQAAMDAVKVMADWDPQKDTSEMDGMLRAGEKGLLTKECYKKLQETQKDIEGTAGPLSGDFSSMKQESMMVRPKLVMGPVTDNLDPNSKTFNFTIYNDYYWSQGESGRAVDPGLVVIYGVQMIQDGGKWKVNVVDRNITSDEVMSQVERATSTN